LKTKIFESGRGCFSRQLLPSFRPAVAEINQSGYGRVCFMKTKKSPTIKSMSRSLLRRGLLIIPLAFACSALSPAAHALLPPPPPDGGYPNNNTAEGDNALFSLTTGTDNTANGFAALVNNTSGSLNTTRGF